MNEEKNMNRESEGDYVEVMSHGQPNDLKVSPLSFLEVAIREVIMNYQFNVELATEYGVDEAIMLHNLIFWLRKNKTNNQNFIEGRTWTYNSADSFSELFPFWNKRKIARVLTSLEDKGVIISGNHNKVKYDRTKWYALNDETLLELPLDKSSNGSAGSVPPIPDSKPNEKTHISTGASTGGGKESPDSKRKNEAGRASDAEQDHICTIYNESGMPRVMKLTDARKRHLKARIKEYSADDVIQVITKAKNSTFCMGENDRGWKADFDWLMNPTNFTKVLEGKYDNSGNTPPKDEIFYKDRVDGKEYTKEEYNVLRECGFRLDANGHFTDKRD
jgi:hypothetical protein